MPKLILFHETTVDGGVATDLDRGDARLYHRRVDWSRGRASTLRWGVRLRCEGEGVPTDPGRVRDWLLDLEPVIRTGLRACADDFDREPDDPDPPMWVRFSWDRFPEHVPGVRLHLEGGRDRESCSLSLGAIVRELAANWKPILEALEADAPVS